MDSVGTVIVDSVGGQCWDSNCGQSQQTVSEVLVDSVGEKLTADAFSGLC